MRSDSFAVKALAVLLVCTLTIPWNAVTALAAKSTTEIQHKGPDDYIPGFRITLKAEVKDEAGLLATRCYFKTSQDDAFLFVDMVGAGGEYQAILPAPWVNSKYVEYLFVIVNGEKKVTRSEVFKMKEKKTKEAKQWKDINEVPEIRIDLAQEAFEKYEIIKKQLIDRYKNKLPEWQDAFARGDINVKTELERASSRARGFYDQMSLGEVPAAEKYGLLVDGLYTEAQIAAAGGSAATSAAGAAAVGSVSAAAGGIGLGWVALGALAAGGGIAAAGAIGGSDSGGSVDVREAQPSDFVGTFNGVDPGRPSSQYRAVFTFNSGGSGSVTEYFAGQSNTSRLNWSFNANTDVFSFGVPGGGSASGVISGTTDNFTLNGRYANGSPATLQLKRQ